MRGEENRAHEKRFLDTNPNVARRRRRRRRCVKIVRRRRNLVFLYPLMFFDTIDYMLHTWKRKHRFIDE